MMMDILGNLFRGKELKNKKAEFERLKDKYITEGERILRISNCGFFRNVLK